RLAIDPQTLLGKRRWEIPAIDAGSAEWRVHREALTRRESFRDFEHPMRLPGGDWGYVSVSGQAVFDQAGIFRGYRGTGRDITARLKAEERLQQSLERFEIVARATNDVVWDWNLLTDQLWWNDNFCGVFGYDAAEVGAFIDSWTARIHPEDAARVKQDIK